MTDLRVIPGVAEKMKGHLQAIGINCVEDLIGQNAEDLFQKHNITRGSVDCRCVLYVYRCAVYYANTENPEFEKLQWNYWKD